MFERLTVLVDVYRALHKARSRRGALEFDAPEAEFVIDAGERVRAIELRVRNEAHKLVEECMILAYVAVAEELEKRHAPTLYRVHGVPKEDRLDRLTSALKSLNIDARIPKTVTTRDLQAIARRVPGRPERAFVEIAGDAGDAAGGLPAGQHWALWPGAHSLRRTSPRPIRRYPDLVVHRTLKALIGAKGGSAAVRYEGQASSAHLDEHLQAREARGRSGPLCLRASSSAII